MALTEYIVRGYESITPFQAAAVLGLAVLFVLYLLLKDMGLPPGPTGLPLVGYWPFLNPETAHFQLAELQKKYGDLFSFRITGRLFVNVGTHKVLKEANVTKSDCFGDRPLDYGIMTHTLGGSVAFTNGEQWKVARKFFLLKFRDYGFNATKGAAIECVYDAMKETIEELKSMDGKPVNVSQFFTTKCTTVMKAVLFRDGVITDEEIKEIIDEAGPALASVTSTNMLLMGNFAKYFIYPFMPSFRAMVPSHDRILSILNDVVKRHKSSYSEDQAMDLIDSFYKERDERKRRGDPTAQFFNDKCLIMSFYQFVTDGVLTIPYFIGMYLHVLVDHPEEQEKIYSELVEVVGPDRSPTMEDKSKLPYTNAFIHEVLRYTDIFPMGPGQVCKKETTLNGYKIPVGAITMVNMWAIHHDPNAYENPDKFDPSRYISAPGKPKAELPVLFGVGKRTCLGEQFSMMQIFLFVVAVVKNFHLSLPKGAENSSTLFFKQGTLEICFNPRSQKEL